MNDSIVSETSRGNVLVTGASRGIGFAILEKFVDQGFHVFGTYNTSVKEVKKIEKQYKDKVSFYRVNFSQKSQIRGFIRKMKKFDFNVLVNNAGSFELEDFDSFDINIWYKILQINLSSMVELCLGLKDNILSPGAIVNISSTDAAQGSFASMSYAASKAGVDSITKSLANNFGRFGVRVNAVSPGWINTSMATQASYDAVQLTPLGRNGKAEEVASLVSYLASVQASFINGSNIVADGGYSNVDYIMKKEAGLL